MNLVASESVNVKEKGTCMARRLDASSSGWTVMKKRENAETRSTTRRDIEMAKSNEPNHVLITRMNVIKNTNPFNVVSHRLKMRPEMIKGSNVNRKKAKETKLEKASASIE